MQRDVENESSVMLNSMVEPIVAPAVAPVAAPVQVQDRIAILDVIRGFALIGIFLMNIEFFNRSVGELSDGMPVGLSGANWLASYFVAYFVAGKFWTIFSLLFGMGFALMLMRAEEKGQDFFKPYFRRLLALAIFGLLHYIFIWPGDILFSYAIAACGLLVVLFGKARWIVLSVVALGLVAVIPALNKVGAIATALALFGVMAFLLRNEKTFMLFAKPRPIIAVILYVVGALLFLIGVTSLVVTTMSSARPSLVFGLFVLLIAFVLDRAHQPKQARSWKIGSLLYTSLFLSMAIGGAAQYLGAGKTQVQAANEAQQASSTVVSASAQAKVEVKAEAENAASDHASVAANDSEKNKASEKAENKKKEAERLQKQLEDNRREVAILSKGTYAEALAFRVREFSENWTNVAIFSVLINCMFLIGYWFVQSGIMRNTQAHLPKFKKMALLGLPCGIGLGIAGSFISTSAVPGLENDPYMFAMALIYLGNLPACLGYVGLLVLMFHSTGVFSKVKLLAPYGRMALTNYLSQSVICSVIFYSYGLGYYGMQRAHQVAVVAIVVVLQILFSHWWLSKFRYGPMEWLWRAITYWKLPALKN
ncbi:DUF418 domain-containing protein [Undibacterium baiyunense]|uniref:DUF418 domain-containing protein n=1 Tax=Undibacterium baiyunense TaxID=2828731 RepID=A0A941DDW7_9BURK|nr:DUF418 domain-containing protein [Undibacterium baiyunense]MBR7746939.1 DUF418 domain-containing protein [Undibacterium baiyunense]